jgi:lysophospholipase L1-like esterase
MSIPKILLTALLAVVLNAGASASGLPFPDGTHYCALGDSITRGGLYHSYVNLFHATRFPGKNLEATNAGISGDTAAGALKRLNWDVFPSDPTVVSIMFGMNDVGSDLYGAGKEGPEIEAQRKQRIETWEQNLRELVKIFQARKIRPILITPSILDETVQSSSTNYPGKSAALAECSARVRALANEENLTVVEFNEPMTELTKKFQAADPAFSLIGKDRIHPAAPGHFVMAYYFLKALNVPQDVAKVVVDGKQGAVQEAKNCQVDKVTAQPDGVTFTYLANALPFPIENDAKPALAWVPFVEDFNRETFVVSGLAAGSYLLSIDGKSVRTYSAEELAVGVNLAVETETPQYQQSLEVLELFKNRWTAIGKLRDIAFVEHGTCRELPRPLTLDQVKPHIEAWLDSTGGKSYGGFFKKCAETYLEAKPKEHEIAADIAKTTAEIRAASQPRPRVVSLKRSAS